MFEFSRRVVPTVLAATLGGLLLGACTPKQKANLPACNGLPAVERVEEGNKVGYRFSENCVATAYDRDDPLNSLGKPRPEIRPGDVFEIACIDLTAKPSYALVQSNGQDGVVNLRPENYAVLQSQVVECPWKN